MKAQHAYGIALLWCYRRIFINNKRPAVCTGEGRVHQCLRDNFQKLTDSCRKEELKLNIIQSRDVRLRPKLNKACSEEIAVYCKDVEKGNSPASHPCSQSSQNLLGKTICLAQVS